MIHLRKLVMVITGGTYNYDRQEISCRETWANPAFHGKDTKVFFVRGIPSPRDSMSVPQILSAKVDLGHETRTVLAHVPDGWAYCTFKQMIALRELSKHYTWDYLVRPNTGSYVNLNLLDETLETLPKKEMVYAVHGQYMGIHYGSGACFTVTSDLSDRLLSAVNQAVHVQMYNMLADDVIMGNIMGGTIHDAPRIEVGRIAPQGFPIGPQVTDDPSTWFDSSVYHYWFASSQTDKAHYTVHRLFYP